MKNDGNRVSHHLRIGHVSKPLISEQYVLEVYWLATIDGSGLPFLNLLLLIKYAL